MTSNKHLIERLRANVGVKYVILDSLLTEAADALESLTPSVERDNALEEAAVRAAYLLRRGVDDLGRGEIDSLLRQVAALKSHPAPPPAGGDEAANEEIVALVRKYAKEVTGGNATFADDDLRALRDRALSPPPTDDLTKRAMEALRTILDGLRVFYPVAETFEHIFREHLALLADYERRAGGTRCEKCGGTHKTGPGLGDCSGPPRPSKPHPHAGSMKA